MLTSAIVEVEGIFNSRPLTYVCTKKAVGTIHLLMGHQIFHISGIDGGKNT